MATSIAEILQFKINDFLKKIFFYLIISDILYVHLYIPTIALTRNPIDYMLNMIIND